MTAPVDVGHSSVAFTMDIYAHAMPKLQEEAAAEMDAVWNTAKKSHRDRTAATAEIDRRAVASKETSN